MRPNKNKCFLFGGFKKFAILKYNMKNTRLQEDDGSCSRLYKKIRAIPNKVRIAR